MKYGNSSESSNNEKNFAALPFHLEVRRALFMFRGNFSCSVSQISNEANPLAWMILFV